MLRVDGPLASYTFRAWTNEPASNQDVERLHLRELGEVLSLLRRLSHHDGAQIVWSALLFEIGHWGVDTDAIETVARLVLRGEIVIERRAIAIAASDTINIGERNTYEPPENEIDDGEGAIAFAQIIEPPYWIVVEMFEPPPALEVNAEPEELDKLAATIEPEPPEIVDISIEPETPPVLDVATSHQGPS